MPEAFAGTDRFELIRRLGEGGFGTVYEAFDRKRSARVALKLLRQAEGRTLYRFKREFRALADISHPNLVALDELLTDGWHWFFTMELVRGIPLVAYAAAHADSEAVTPALGPFARFDESRLRFALSQLADALYAIHRAGIVHCDIKPSNVLVTPENRVVLLDFGLVSEPSAAAAADDDTLSSIVVVGTPAYMAPEQATAQRVTPAADWYSVGVMLYQILAGRMPFSGSNLEVIEAKQDGRPSPLAEVNGHAPRDLATLAMDLLDPVPEHRPSGEAVLRRVGRPTVAPHVIGPRNHSAPDLFLGRATHLQRLADALDSARRGKTVVAFVAGLSGMGKTALIRRFLKDQRARDPDLLVLTSRCYERESMPYKAIDPLVDALAQHLQRLNDIDVARVLPRDVAILARMFPVLLGVEEVRRTPQPAVETMDSVTVRQRAAAALRDLLYRVAVRAPLVLVIDDLQWGDIDSAAILQEILRPPEAPPLLLVTAYRSEDVGEARLLRALNKTLRDAGSPSVCDIEVGALTDEETRQLALRLTAGTGDALPRAEAIARESGGNAFFVHQLAQHSATVGGSTSLDAVVHDRVQVLPEPARRLMTAIALSAQSVPAHVAAAAAGFEGENSEPLQLLRASRLVRVRSDQITVEAYHDRIREAVVTQLEAADMPEWHRRLAVAWERSGVARPDTLVAHFNAAGDAEKTREYAAAAAEKATEALAFDRAAEFFALLVRLEPESRKRRQWRINLGQALANTGRGHEAATAFLAALDGAAADQVIELERRAATELIRAGYLDEANAVLYRLLPRVGVRPPGDDRSALMSLLRFRALLAMRGTGFRERPESEIAPARLRRIDVLTSISPELCLSSFMQGTALNVQSMWYALRAGEPRRVVIALTALAAQMGVGGTRTERRAQNLVRKAQALAVRLHDPWAAGRTVMAEGMVLKLNGHWKQAVERLRQSNEILATCTGVRWETETAQILIHDALYFMGEWSQLARELPAQRHDAEQRGDLYSAVFVSARMSPLVHIAADEADQARKDVDSSLARWTKRQFSLQHRFAVCSGVDIALYEDNPEGAFRCLSDAWPDLRRMIYFIQHHRIEMLFYRARVALAQAAHGDVSALSRAEGDARRLHRERAPWARAVAALVRATVAQGRGKAATARTELEAAEVELRRSDMNLFAAAAQCRRATLIGGDAGDTLRAAAFQWMRDQNIANPERVVGLLAPGPW